MASAEFGDHGGCVIVAAGLECGEEQGRSLSLSGMYMCGL
jgi:hypothetical protein